MTFCICDYSHVKTHKPGAVTDCFYYVRLREAISSLEKKEKDVAEYIEPPESAWGKQEGGDHYKDLPIQPSEYIVRNSLGWFAGNVVKYVTRYEKKGGLQDLRKARHYLDLLIEDEEKNNG